MIATVKPASASAQPDPNALRLTGSSGPELETRRLDPADTSGTPDPRAAEARAVRLHSGTPADLARHVGRQMAEAFDRPGDRPVEVALDPVELGRVRLNLHSRDHTITVTVMADRPETLDLMRRNIGELAQQFREIGYDQINFAFGQSGHEAGTGAQPGSPDPDTRPDQERGTVAPAIPSLSPRAATARDGLDIRL